jgi:hypothetical protein
VGVDGGYSSGLRIVPVILPVGAMAAYGASAALRGDNPTTASEAEAGSKIETAEPCDRLKAMVLPVRIELTTSPLPRGCSTTELRQRTPRALSVLMESELGPSFLFEHDPSGQARGHAFPKTGSHPRIESEGKLFGIMLQRKISNYHYRLYRLERGVPCHMGGWARKHSPGERRGGFRLVAARAWL